MKKYSSTQHKAIALPLACAASALLGHALPAAAADVSAEWDFDSALLFYTETDRVSAVEPVVAATRRGVDGSILSFKGVIDVLTGASATGAVPTDSAQTFTRPSGNASYSVAAGDTPLDDTFTMRPPPPAIMWRAAWKQVLAGPSRLTPRMRCHAAHQLS